MNFYLIRHAEYSNPRHILPGRLPVILSKTGISQAKKLTNYFNNKQIDIIFSSPVKRCQQTSEIISNNKIPIKYNIELAETFSSFQGFWKRDSSYYYGYQPELGGETPQDILNRVKKFWKDINKQNYKNIIICSHGDPLYILYTYLANLPIPNLVSIYEIPSKDYQPKASIREIIVNDKKIKIKNIITVDNL